MKSQKGKGKKGKNKNEKNGNSKLDYFVKLKHIQNKKNNQISTSGMMCTFLHYC